MTPAPTPAAQLMADPTATGPFPSRGCTMSDHDTDPDVLVREFATPTPVRLQVRAGAGRVQIDAADTSETQAEVRPTRPGDDAARDLVTRTTVEQRGDQVVVEVPRRGAGFLRRSPELVISVQVPMGSSLEVTTESADVRTSGALDRVHSRTGSGDLVVQRAGEAHVQTGSGDTDLDLVDGSVRVQTGSGDVVARSVGDGCSVESGSGDVRVLHVSGPLQVNTGSGDVSVDDADDDVTVNTASGDPVIGRVHRGDIRVNSASGDISVGVVGGTPVWLDVTSLTGSVHSALTGGDPPEEGEDSVALRVNTVSGDVSLSRA